MSEKKKCRKTDRRMGMWMGDKARAVVTLSCDVMDPYL